MSPWDGGSAPAAPGVTPRALRMATSDGWDEEVVDRSAVFGALGIVMAPYSDWLNGDGVPAGPAWVSLQPSDETLASHTGQARTSWRILEWDAWSSRKTLASALFEPHDDALIGVGYDVQAGDEPDDSRRIYPGTGARLFSREVEKQLRTAAIWLRRAPSAQPFRTARTVITVEATKQAVLAQTRWEAAA